MKKDSSDMPMWFDPSDLLNQLMLVLVGVVVLLVNMGMVEPDILMYWPVILIIIGFRALLHHR